MGSERGGTPSIPVALKNLATGIDELCAALDGPDVDDSDAASCATMRALAALRRRFTAVFERRLAAFHARGTGLHDGALSTQAWLRHQTGMSLPEAGREVKIARALNALPTAADAHTAGTLSADKLVLLHQVAEKLGPERFAPAEALMVEQAQDLTVHGLRHALAALRNTLDPGAQDRDHARREQDRELYLASTLDGIWSLRGTLTPECGAALSAILMSVTPKPTPEDERSAPQRRHDAAHDLFRAVLDQGALPNIGGEKPHIGVVTHLTDITGPASLSSLNPHCCPTPATCPHAGAAPTGPQGGADVPEGTVPEGASGGRVARPGGAVVDGGARSGRAPRLPHLPVPGHGGLLDGGGHLPSVALQRLACDSQVHRVVFSPAGALLDVGRAQRTVPTALRRALVARDGGCRFPGCDRPFQWCDAHHAVGWAQGGATSADNCLLICRGHHGLIHDQGWHLAFDGVTVTVTRPDGSHFDEPP